MYSQQSDTVNSEGKMETGLKSYKFDNATQKSILASIFLIISVIGTFGNLLVILAVILSRKLRTATNVFVVNLSAADLLTCLFLPWNVVALLGHDGFPLPDDICSFAAFVTFTCVGCSLYTLAAIAINRWILITRSISVYRALYKPVNLTAMVIIIWSVPLLISLVPTMTGFGDIGYSDKYSTCSQNTSHPLSDDYSFLQGAVYYPVPLLIIIICYLKVWHHVTKHHKAMVVHSETSNSSSYKASDVSTKRRLSKRQIEITKNLFYVVVAFVLCITPFAVSLMVPKSDPAIPWTSALLLCNSAVNPIIYATKHPYFKQIFKHMLLCKWSKIPEQSDVLRSVRRISRSIGSHDMYFIGPKVT